MRTRLPFLPLRSFAAFGMLCLFALTVYAQPAAAPAPPTPIGDAAEKRKICAEAMNADPSFAAKIVDTVNENTAKEHRRAAAAIAKNERHVVLAYASMWIVAAAFVLFLWRRQQLLKTEIAQLRRDLDAATSDSSSKAPPR